jgi:phosphoglycolate phosphatase-like HAD superfamily hydrolase
MVVMVTLLSCARRLAVVVLVMLVCIASDARAQSDPLPSWNDGAAKQAILDFVARVTRDDGPDHVPTAARIAVFDNDGTLWAEQPVYVQAVFALDRIKALAPRHPEWTETQPYKGVIEGDAKAIAETGEKGIAELLAVSHAGMTTEAFAKTVADWLATARHPRFRQPYDKLVYQPQTELLAYLRAHQFKTFIVSGGGVEFMRVFAETTYGIPPEQVVGSSGVVTFELGADGTPQLVKQTKIEFVDDGPGKPVGINRFIGRRPILAFGNSDGDHQMLQYVMAGPGARFAGIVHHTDSTREYAYDRSSKIGQLDKAWDEAEAKGWTIVDMKRDWRKVFAFEP